MNNHSGLLPWSSLIERGELPLIDLAALAMREGRRPRAIYTAHKWFARRLGTIFRALLVGTVSSPDDDFWQRYYGAANLHGLTILDRSLAVERPSWKPGVLVLQPSPLMLIRSRARSRIWN
jgi:hypothetical protein